MRSKSLAAVGRAALLALACAAPAPAELVLETEPPPQPATEAEEALGIDVVFCLDATGSMGSEIQAAKDRIREISKEIRAPAEDSATPLRVRFGMVVYRDRTDAEELEVLPLTSDVEAVKAFLDPVQASGGGDGPENVRLALKTAVQDMAWSTHHDGVKMIFLVGDAPPHTDYEDLPSCMQSAAAANEKGISISTLGAGGIAAGGPGRELWEKLAEETYGTFEALSRGGHYAMAPGGLALEAEEMAFADGAGGGAVLRSARSRGAAAPAPSAGADFSRIVVEGVREKTREALAKRRR